MAKRKYYVIEKFVKIPYSRHGIYKKVVTSQKPSYIDGDEDNYITIRANNIQEAREIWDRMQNLHIPFEELEKIVRKYYPNATYEAITALDTNIMHKGLIYERLLYNQPITKSDIYRVVVAYYRHQYTEYENGQMGDDMRPLFNDHDEAKRILGIDE